jgi:hypothetical protein
MLCFGSFMLRGFHSVLPIKNPARETRAGFTKIDFIKYLKLHAREAAAALYPKANANAGQNRVDRLLHALGVTGAIHSRPRIAVIADSSTFLARSVVGTIATRLVDS